MKITGYKFINKWLDKYNVDKKDISIMQSYSGTHEYLKVYSFGEDLVLKVTNKKDKDYLPYKKILKQKKKYKHIVNVHEFHSTNKYNYLLIEKLTNTDQNNSILRKSLDLVDDIIRNDFNESDMEILRLIGNDLENELAELCLENNLHKYDRYSDEYLRLDYNNSRNHGYDKNGVLKIFDSFVYEH